MRFLLLLSSSLPLQYVIAKFISEMLTALQIKSILHSLSLDGNIEDLGRLSRSVDAREYEQFHGMVGQVLNDKKDGPILSNQLEKWAMKAR